MGLIPPGGQTPIPQNYLPHPRRPGTPPFPSLNGSPLAMGVSKDGQVPIRISCHLPCSHPLPLGSVHPLIPTFRLLVRHQSLHLLKANAHTLTLSGDRGETHTPFLAPASLRKTQALWHGAPQRPAGVTTCPQSEDSLSSEGPAFQVQSVSRRQKHRAQDFFCLSLPVFLRFNSS